MTNCRNRVYALAAGGCIAMLMACCLSTSLAQTQPQANTRKPLVPGEQAPPANPGQRNFGGMAPAAGAGGQRRPPMSPRPAPPIQTISLDGVSDRRTSPARQSGAEEFRRNGPRGRRWRTETATDVTAAGAAHPDDILGRDFHERSLRLS